MTSKTKANGLIDRLAAWTHHQITAIHPFHNGNGRMARIMNNLVLRRFALQPSDIQHLGDNKAKYLDALCQIDKAGDYGPLERMVAEGMQTTYEKVYAIAKKNAAKKGKKPRHRK